jgi:aminoglycoside phosphotransferase (APT) family kinase protein
LELQELSARLGPFCRAHYPGADPEVFDVVQMPGHAGFAYGFRVRVGDGVDSWFIRLPPPNVRWVGTADVLRQVTVLRALEGSAVPHCSVRWSGDDLQWFGCPYFIVPWLEGDVLRRGPGEWAESLDEGRLIELGTQAIGAMAGIHAIDPGRVEYLGQPVPFEDDVVRWDRFYERAADPERLRDAPAVREKLLASMPSDAQIGVFHGDFQTANLFCSSEGRLLAIIDFELCGIGAVFNDLGWMATFSDAKAWVPDHEVQPPFLDPETLIAMYEETTGSPVADIDWYRALAAYKFAIITGFNLALHRRGKRPDPLWEKFKGSMTSLIDRANELLG